MSDVQLIGTITLLMTHLGVFWGGVYIGGLGKRAPRVHTIKRPMTSQEREAVDRAFEHVDKAFEEAGKAFDLMGKIIR